MHIDSYIYRNSELIEICDPNAPDCTENAECVVDSFVGGKTTTNRNTYEDIAL